MSPQLAQKWPRNALKLAQKWRFLSFGPVGLVQIVQSWPKSTNRITLIYSYSFCSVGVNPNPAGCARGAAAEGNPRGTRGGPRTQPVARGAPRSKNPRENPTPGADPETGGPDQLIACLIVMCCPASRQAVSRQARNMRSLGLLVGVVLSCLVLIRI